MRLSMGEAAPRLATVDFLGAPVSLSALRGKRVMLSFYRYASCPICNLRMHELIVAHAALAGRGLNLIAVFQSPAESIAEYVGRQDAPFPIVADPSMALYRQFGVESRWAGLSSLQVIRRALKAFAKGFAPGRIDGPFHRVHADFLIDEAGRIAVAHYGRHLDDHLPMTAIQRWLDESPAEKAAA